MSKSLRGVTERAILKNWPGPKEASRQSTEHYMRMKQEEQPPTEVEPEPEAASTEEEESAEDQPPVGEGVVSSRAAGDSLAKVETETETKEEVEEEVEEETKEESGAASEEYLDRMEALVDARSLPEGSWGLWFAKEAFWLKYYEDVGSVVMGGRSKLQKEFEEEWKREVTDQQYSKKR